MAALELLSSALAVTGSVPYPLAVTCTDRINGVGQMVFTVYVGSPGAASCVPGQYVRWSDGAYTFEGIVDTVARGAQDDGAEILTVTCAHIAREAVYATTGLTGFSSGDAPTTVALANDKIESYINAGAPAAWAVTESAAVGALTVYLQSDGASAFTMLLSVADKVGAWLVRGASGRALAMTATWAASGITARPVAGDKPANVAALLTLTREETAADLVTSIYPFSAGNAAVRVGVEVATAALPGGYTKQSSNWGAGVLSWSIRNTAAFATFGRRDRFVQFADINPLSNSGPDIISAANALQAAAVTWLANQAKVRIAYTMTVDDSPAPVMPGQSLTVQFTDLDTTLYCVEATHTWTPGAPLRSVLRVTDGSPWITSSVAETVRAMEAARVYRAHAQLAPNVYQLSYNKPVDAQYGAEFRFRFDEGITQVLFVALDVQLQPLQSTVRAIGAAGVKTSAYAAAAHTHNIAFGVGHDHYDGQHTHPITTTLQHSHPIRLISIPRGTTYPDGTVVYGTDTILRVAEASAGADKFSNTQNTGSASINTGQNAASTSITTKGLAGDKATDTGGAFTHDHTVDMTVTMEYGIYRDSTANTFAVADLEYQINSAGWLPLTLASSLGDGWYRIPLTNTLVDLSTFYPLAKSNKVTVRAVAISAATETFVVGGTPTGQFNRWNDAGTYVQQVTGTAATALALSPNGWLYLLRKAAGTVTIYSAAANGTLAAWDTWTLGSTGMNALTVDARTGSKWYGGDAGFYGKDGATPNTAIAGGAVISYMAAFGGRVYFSTASNTLVMVPDFVGSGASQSGVTAAPLAARNDGTIVQCTSLAASFALRVWQPDLSGFTNCTRSDAGNAWTPLSLASAANLVHVGCSDGRVRTYALDPAVAAATLVWTSTGTPGATGYPTATSLLGVAAVLSSKAAMIDAQLTVRSVVQAIVMN